MSDWQPIETAPKDGTRVLVSRALAGEVGEAYCYNENRWFWANTDPSDNWADEIWPTHWMPLPEPPK